MNRCTVGVMAYNEEQNIVQVLQALLNQQLHEGQIDEIVVVASGCTDRTVELAEAVARAHPAIIVDVQQERAGKAAAINRLIGRAKGDVIALVGADTLPDPQAVEHLLRPFADPSVGMTGARVVPLNAPSSFLGFTVHLLWHVHHRLALHAPKLGELVAFRNVVPELPVDSATDEVALEAAITERGYRLAYVPEAVVYNRGPQTLEDFLHQRRRIFAGHLQVASRSGYVAASMPLGNLSPRLLELVRQYPRAVPWITGAMLLECWARALGTLDFVRGHSHGVWRPIGSSKQVYRQCQSLMLVVLQCCDGSIQPGHLADRARRIPPAQGALLWWDHMCGQVLFLVPGEGRVEAPVEEHVKTLAEHIGFRYPSATSPVLSYRVIRFAPTLGPQHGARDAEEPMRELAVGA